VEDQWGSHTEVDRCCVSGREGAAGCQKMQAGAEYRKSWRRLIEEVWVRFGL
jgi:hypothetical protein